MNALPELEVDDLGVRQSRRRDGLRASAVLDLLRASDTPALASDLTGRVILWNTGAERLLHRPERLALGRLCHDLLAGRDVFGNLFCHKGCAIRAMCHAGEAIQAFELVVDSPQPAAAFQVSILKVPGATPDEDVLVHLLQPLDREGRLAREMGRLGFSADAGLRSTEATTTGETPAPLTPRERDVLARMAEGLQNKEIAQALDISLATVRNHVHNLLEKLDVHSKLEAISLAYRNGWVASPPARNEHRSAPRFR